MRKKRKIFIVTMVLSLLTFKEITYCSISLIEESKNISTVYSIDPPVDDKETVPKSN